MAKIGKNLEGLDRCPQCGVAAPMLALTGGFADLEKGTMARVWFFYQCRSCSDFVAAMGLQSREKVGVYGIEQIATSWGGEAILVMPEPERIDEDIPEQARNYIEQAIASKDAPDGAVMLAGSAVDSMLKKKGFLKGSLYERIDQAVSDHILTIEMGEWAHEVRLGSNRPRHADIDSPHATSDDAIQSIAFVKALAEFMFVLPARVKRGKAAAMKVSN